MKITTKQLKRIIREELEQSTNQHVADFALSVKKIFDALEDELDDMFIEADEAAWIRQKFRKQFEMLINTMIEQGLSNDDIIAIDRRLKRYL